MLLLAALFIQLIKSFLRDEKELPYKAKPFLFSRSEHEFLRILNEQIDTKRYMIFPKVRLADFIEVTTMRTEWQGWWNKIRSKHVDFLIWDVEQNKITLAIELDGNSHNSEKMQRRDEFVDQLYERIGVKLARVRVSSDFEVIASEITQKLKQ